MSTINILYNTLLSPANLSSLLRETALKRQEKNRCQPYVYGNDGTQCSKQYSG